MLTSLLKGGLLGGITLFIWGAVSWTVLPWHDVTLNKFTNEDAVVAAITANATKPGVYFLPNARHEPGMTEADKKAAWEAAEKRMAEGPVMFASVRLKGAPSMLPYALTGIVISIIGATLGTLLLLQIRETAYLRRAGFLALFGFTAGVVCFLPYWNWFDFSTAYTVASIADLAIGWFLTGLVIAKVAAPGK
jgi:hypothetical protein